MNVDFIKHIYFSQPFLRKILSPLRYIKRSFVLKRLASRKQLLFRLQNILVDDPIISVDEFGGVFSLDVRSDIFSRIVLYGKYEPELVNICTRLLDKNRDVIDVGANIGFFSIFFAKKLSGTNKVLSIEPAKASLKRLYINISKNNVENKVVVFEGVVSNRKGVVEIKTITGKEEYSTLGAMIHPATSNVSFTKESVISSTIDEINDKYNLNPGFIKIDVEGAEHLVLEGAQSVLKNFRPIILSELSDDLLKKNGSSAEDVIETIKQFRYTVYDPIHPKVIAGRKDYGDILCIPNELLLQDDFPTDYK